MNLNVTTEGAEETIRLGRLLGKVLKPGHVVCLYGDLGTGKTTLIKGIASAFKISEDEITSASFLIIAEHYGDHPLYHIDLYRLERIDDILETGIEEYLESDGIAVIEWAERFKDCPCTLKITIKMKSSNERTFIIESDNKEMIENIKTLLEKTG
ncbi:MAG: tRNA (adenosine(37)-N6)-threonylcarbamoyltransferase complex ATPase subunit type 1 TsaE [Nitrospirae bacterium]|nr:tRNA (adenosine(37)-N6)-threonylcarbamoyltransferase complex ATPase subunit type 1 TsaE [Nitrospirota bacterium]